MWLGHVARTRASASDLAKQSGTNAADSQPLPPTPSLQSLQSQHYLLTTTSMSHILLVTLSSRFQTIFNDALEIYI